MKKSPIVAMNRQPTPQEELAVQEILDEFRAAGLLEINGMRDGKPVYAAADKLRKGWGRISERPRQPNELGQVRPGSARARRRQT